MKRVDRSIAWDRAARAAWTCVAAFAAGACAVRGNWRADGLAESREIPVDDVEWTIVAVGDAGDAYLPGERQVLDAVSKEAARRPATTLVVFVGDNVYMNTDDKDRDAKLDAQIDAVLASGAAGVFILGNHDHRTADGPAWEGGRISARLDEAVAEGKGRVDQIRLLPEQGSLGPHRLDLGDRARLEFLDTELWLADADVGGALGETACRKIMEDANSAEGRRVLLFGHHPIATHGPHGGYFSGRDVLFYEDIPVPILGPALYSLGSWVSDRFGDTDWAQNLRDPRYAAFKRRFDRLLAESSAFAYVAGHEHSLQWISADVGGSGAVHQVVSGAGSPESLTSVGIGEDTRFASGRPGFAKIEFLRDGGVRLEFVEVDPDPDDTRRIGFWLARPRPVAVR